MAEYVMKHLVKEHGRQDEFEITSGAVSREEIGNDIYPPAKRKLQEKGVEFSKHRAHQITPDEFSQNDLIITMDSSNMRLLSRIVPTWESTAAGETSSAKSCLTLWRLRSSARMISWKRNASMKQCGRQ